MKKLILLTLLLLPLITFSQIQLGSDIDGKASNDKSGRSVSIDSDGSHVAIGAYNNDGGGSNAGHVPVLINALKELESETSSLESQMSEFEKIIPELIEQANQNKK